MAAKVVLCVLVAGFGATVTSHQLVIGRCTKPAGMTGFDKQQFFGAWKIVAVDGGINRCITQEFSQKEGSTTDITVKQDRILRGGLQAPSVYGTLEPKEPGLPSEFTVEWLLSGRFSDMSYTVLDTDYTTYALTYECQQVGPLRYKQGTILARPDVTLTPEVISQLKDQASGASLDFSNTRTISHADCEARTVEEAVNLFGFLKEDEAAALVQSEANTPKL